jgi:hypothetical protein
VLCVVGNYELYEFNCIYQLQYVLLVNCFSNPLGAVKFRAVPLHVLVSVRR